MSKRKKIDVSKGSQPEDIQQSERQEEGSSAKSRVRIEVRKGATEELCKLLNKSTDAFERDKWIELLENYNSQFNRPYYSTITDYIYNCSVKTRDSTHEQMLENIKKVMDWTEESGYKEKKSDDYEKLIRFQDHVALAVFQCRMFNARGEELDRQIEAKTKEVADERIREMTKDITGQLIGLVAIFTALSFVVFGGISSLDSILDSLAESKRLTSTLMVATAWMFCMGNLLFAFMYFILKITRKEVNERAENHVRKYPLVWLLNFVCIAVFVVCAAIHFAWTYGIGEVVWDWVQEYNTMVFFLGFVVIVFGLVMSGNLIFSLYYQKEAWIIRLAEGFKSKKTKDDEKNTLT